MYVLVTYVPSSHLEEVKEALFNAGAGHLGSYDHCSWQVEGRGQFRPLEGSHPFLGEKDVVEYASEYRLEMVVSEDLAVNAIQALKKAHPYEVPAYHLIPVLTIDVED